MKLEGWRFRWLQEPRECTILACHLVTLSFRFPDLLHNFLSNVGAEQKAGYPSHNGVEYAGGRRVDGGARADTRQSPKRSSQNW